MNDRRPDGPAALEDPAQVTSADLSSIDRISALLLTFNDARAGADALARHIVKIRVLKARVEQRFVQRYPNRQLPGVAQQVALLGNRELEALLLQLLEDVVTLASELGAERTG